MVEHVRTEPRGGEPMKNCSAQPFSTVNHSRSRFPSQFTPWHSYTYTKVHILIRNQCFLLFFFKGSFWPQSCCLWAPRVDSSPLHTEVHTLHRHHLYYITSIASYIFVIIYIFIYIYVVCIYILDYWFSILFLDIIKSQDSSILHHTWIASLW